jgi:hypothetical protein
MEKQEFTAETFKAAFPEIHEEIRRAGFDAGCAEGLKTGREEGMEAGAEKERERIREIEKISVPGHEALIEKMKFDGRTTGPEAAVQVLEAEGALRRTKLESFVAETVSPAKTVVVTAEAESAQVQEANLPVEERAKRQWDRSPELREEFKMGGFKSFLSYLRNEKNIRIFKKAE